MTDEYQLRRRTNAGHIPDSFPVGDTGIKSGMESHDIAQGKPLTASSTASSPSLSKIIQPGPNQHKNTRPLVNKFL